MKENDTELLKQIRETDSESAFRALFERHYDRMFRIAVYFMQNDEWAKDVALDVLADIWEKRKTALIPNDFRHYTFVAVRNASLNMMKKEARLTDEGQAVTDANVEPVPTDPQSLMEESELFEQYERLLAELPDRCREVFCLVKEEGRSYAEAAETMHISVRTVDAQMQKALHHLRSNLEKYLDRKAGKRFFTIFL